MEDGMRRTVLLVIGILALAGVSAGCDADVSRPAPADGVHMRHADVAVIDVDGSWRFERELKLTVPPWAAELVFGIAPEGNVTHIRCESGGSMAIDQDGSTFTGMASYSGACRTAGGQVFTTSRPAIVIAAGVVRGRSIEFVWVEDGFLNCPHHAVVSSDDLSGTGRCVVPGHPQSPVPLDPPPGGTSKTVSFRAWRS
jgi:hypothetical protein